MIMIWNVRPLTTLFLLLNLAYSEPWLISDNAAGLQHLKVDRLSFAEVYMTHGFGDFVNYHQSDNDLTWGTRTESYCRLSSDVVFYGLMAYANYTGQRMGGSAFIDPYQQPLNLVELTNTERGRKSKETYHLTGAVSKQWHPQWVTGAKVDYMTVNYAKYKDLRHTNSLLDLKASAGTTYASSPKLTLGAHYLYRRRVESVAFQSYGNTDRMYSTLVDFGGFYGRSELFGSGSGQYVRKNTDIPMFQQYHSVGAQLDWRISPLWRWHNDYRMQQRSGYYGKKSPYSPVLTEHSGTAWIYTGSLWRSRGNRHHQWQLSVAYERLANYENIYQEQPEMTGGYSDIVYFGQTRMLNRRVWNAHLHYRFACGEQVERPHTSMTVGLDASEQNQTVTVYPYDLKQTMRYAQIYVSAQHHGALNQKAEYQINGGLTYGNGSHNDRESTYQQPASNQKAPQTTLFNRAREYDYLTAARWQGQLGAGYIRRLNSKLQGYLHAKYSYTQAVQTTFIDDNRHHEMRIAVGCIF